MAAFWLELRGPLYECMDLSYPRQIAKHITLLIGYLILAEIILK